MSECLPRSSSKTCGRSRWGLGLSVGGLAISLAGVTQVALAQALGLSQPYVSDVARQRYRNITVNNARRFADYFGCRIEDLFPPRRT